MKRKMLRKKLLGKNARLRRSLMLRRLKSVIKKSKRKDKSPKRSVR